MIYSNKSLKVEVRKIADFEISIVTMGEEGRGRREVRLPVPQGMQEIPAGVSSGLTIGTTKTGRPRINRGENPEMYLLLDTKKGYTRRGDGFVRVLKKYSDNVKVLERGNSADGDAGRIGTADALVLRATAPCWLKVIYGGNSTIEFLYVDTTQKTVKCIQKEDMDPLSDVFSEVPSDWHNIENWEKL